MKAEDKQFFKEQIAEELTRQELIDRLCEINEQYQDLKEEYATAQQPGGGEEELEKIEKVIKTIEDHDKQLVKKGQLITGLTGRINRLEGRYESNILPQIELDRLQVCLEAINNLKEMGFLINIHISNENQD